MEALVGGYIRVLGLLPRDIQKPISRYPWLWRGEGLPQKERPELYMTGCAGRLVFTGRTLVGRFSGIYR